MYNPLTSDVKKWIRDAMAQLERDGIPEAERPAKAMDYIANPTIRTVLRDTVEHAQAKYNESEPVPWDLFEKFMVEFDSEWFLVATINLFD